MANLSRDFRPLFLFIVQLYLGPFEYGFEHGEIFNYEIGFLWSAVSLIPLTCGGWCQ
jgi:hypothetical protein